MIMTCPFPRPNCAPSGVSRHVPNAGTVRIPAVALTAYAGVEDRMRMLSVGYQNHLPKPVEPMELTTVAANLAALHALLVAV